MARMHLHDIEAGHIDKGNLIGIRKLFNANARDERGYSNSCTSPRLKPGYVTAIARAIATHKPVADRALHLSGLAVLRNPRWRHRWSDAQRAIIDSLAEFRLTGFIMFDCCHYPVWRAVSESGDSFLFYNLPWQTVAYSRDPSLQNGPTIVTE